MAIDHDSAKFAPRQNIKAIQRAGICAGYLDENTHQIRIGFFSFATNDFSLATALKQHVRFVYDQANRNQRRAAKLLGISRSTLARYLRDAAPN
jgi:transcriptional regulator of acetoin/glycerol metabolism